MQSPEQRAAIERTRGRNPAAHRKLKTSLLSLQAGCLNPRSRRGVVDCGWVPKSGVVTPAADGRGRRDGLPQLEGDSAENHGAGGCYPANAPRVFNGIHGIEEAGRA